MWWTYFGEMKCSFHVFCYSSTTNTTTIYIAFLFYFLTTLNRQKEVSYGTRRIYRVLDRPMPNQTTPKRITWPPAEPTRLTTLAPKQITRWRVTPSRIPKTDLYLGQGIARLSLSSVCRRIGRAKYKTLRVCLDTRPDSRCRRSYLYWLSSGHSGIFV